MMPQVKKGARKISSSQQINYLSFLSQAVHEISSSEDYASTLRNVAFAMVPDISDWCAIDIGDGHKKLKRLVAAHIDPKKIEMAMELGRKYPRAPDADSGTPHVMKTGEPEMFNGITDDMLAAAAIDDAHLEMMRALNFHSLMIVPIKSHGKTLGTLTFVWAESGRAYSLADLAFAEILSAFAGNAIDSSKLNRA